jgi:peroxiredoxin
MRGGGRGRSDRGRAAATLLAAALAASCGAAPQDDASSLSPAGPGAAPPPPADPVDLELPSLDGDTFRLSDHRGEVVVLHFFATFDAPSQSLAAMLEQAHAEHAAEGLVVVGVAMDPETGRGRRAEVVESYCALNNLSFEVLLSTPELEAGQTGVRRIPEIPATIVFDREGRPAASFTGVFLRSELETLLARILAGTTP